MAQVIARIYATADKAASAASAARGLGYGESEVFVCGPSAGAAKADLAASLAQAGVSRDDTDAFADEVAKGRSVVIVHAAFGGGAKATAALDKFDPIAAPPTKFTTPEKKANGAADRGGPLWTGETKLDEAAPLSNMFNWPTLLNSATPLSDWLKFPALRDSKPRATLSDEAAPLSKKMGWKVLKDDPTPLSSKMGWQVLRDDPTPLSNKLNLSVLKD